MRRKTFKKIGFFAFLGFVLSMAVGTLASCGPSQPSVNADGKIIPSYEGMQIDGAHYNGSNEDETLSFNNKVHNRKPPEGGTAHEPDDTIENSTEDLVDIEFSSDMPTAYHVMENDPFEIHLKFNNPDKFEIVSFIINGTKFLAWQENVRVQDVENIYVEWSGLSMGYHDLVIEQIKYISDTTIRKEDDVRYNADRTIKVSVEAPDFKVPTVSGMKINYNYNDFSINSSFTYSNNGFDIDLAETYFAISDGENVIYNVPLKEGYNTHKIAGVVPNTRYQYSIAVAYDRYDGRGKMLHTLATSNLNSNIAIQEEVIAKTDGIRVTASTPTAAVIHEIALYENSVEEVPVETYVYSGDTYYDFDGLYSDHSYILSILYSYTVDGITYYCYADKNVSTLKNPEPAVDIKFKSSTFDTLTVDFVARNAEFIENYDLLVYEKEDPSRTPVFKSDKLETTLTLENLYSDTYYVYEYTLDYDLKDNHGIRTKVCRAEYYTKGKADVKFTFKNSNSGPNFISFTLDIEDKDNVLLSATLSVSDYHSNDVIYTKELDSFDDQMIKVENLLSNKTFKAKVVYKYDKGDGTGEHNSTSETHQISTLNTKHPNPQIWAENTGYDYIKLNISYGDYTSVTKYSYVDVYLEPLYGVGDREFVEKVETVQGINTFSGLYSGREYFFDFHLIYDLYDGEGEREKTVEYSISTASLYVPYLSCWFDSPSYDSIVFEFYIENIDSLLNYKSYLVDTDWNYYDGDWKNKNEVIKELDLKPGKNLVTGLGSYLNQGILFEMEYDLNNGEGKQKVEHFYGIDTTRSAGSITINERYEDALIELDLNDKIEKQEYDIQVAEVLEKGETPYQYVEGEYISYGQLESGISHEIGGLKPAREYNAYVETDGLNIDGEVSKNKYHLGKFVTHGYSEPWFNINVLTEKTTKTSATLYFDGNLDSVVEYEFYFYHDEWDDRTQTSKPVIDKYLDLEVGENLIEDLYSGHYYNIGYRAKYKSYDGSEILDTGHKYINSFNTNALIRPEFTASNLITGYNSFTFNFNIDDPDNAIKDYNVVVRDAHNWSYAKTLGKVAPGKVHVNNLYASNFVVIVEYQCDYNNPNNSGLETVHILENVILGDAPVYIFGASNVQSSYDTISFDFNIDENYKELQSYRVYVLNDNTRSEVKDLGQLEKGKYTIEGLDGDTSYSVYIEYQYKSSDEQIRTGLWELFTNIKTKISGIPYVNISNTSEGYHDISFDVSVNSDVEIIDTKYIIKNPNGDQVGVVENPEDNHVVFDELNASTGYTVVVEFTVIDANGETKILEEVFVTFAMTLSYSAPGFAANNIKIGNNFFEFDFVVNDPDNVLVGDYNVKILDNQGNVVKNLGKLESGKQRVSGLFTGQYYEVVVDFKYDLKDGFGETPVQTTRLLAESTKWTEHVQFIANHFVVDEDTISFDFNVIDNDNMLVGDYTVKLESSWGWGVIKTWKNLKPGRITVDNLDSGHPFNVSVEYKYNNSDGVGIQSNYIYLASNIYTNQKTSVDVSADNFEIGYDKVSFDFVMEDPSGVLVDTYYIEVRDEETQTVVDIINNPQTGRVVIDGLKSGKHYSFKLVYKYNMNDGNGDIEVSHYLWSSYTTAYSPVDVSINSVTTGYETITFTLNVNDKDGILKNDFHINIKDENGTIIKSIDNPEAGEITVSGLNSDTKYFIELVYTYNMNDGQGDLVNTRTVWSGNTKKYTPVNVHINNVNTDYEEISFTLNIDDKDNRLTGNYFVNIVSEDGVVVATLDSPESGTYKFSNLNANTTYHIEIVYTYDLNNGNGPVEVKEELWFGSTKEYGAVNVTLNNLSTNEESIRFTINVDDEFGVLVGDVYVDIVHDSTLTVVETIKVTSGEEIIVDGLFSNNDYSLVIRYVSDMKDGNGPTEKATTVWYGHTNAYDAVNVNITNFTYDKESLTFDYIAENPKGLDVVVIVEIYDHNMGELVATYNPTLGSNTISGLRSDRYYRVNVRYLVDYNDGADPVENWLGDIYYFTTESYDAPNVNVDNVTTTETTISFDVFVDDKNNHILDITAGLYYDGKVEQTMTIEGSGRYTFENTYSSTNYEVIITVTFDRNTGHEETITRNAWGYTSDYAEPKVGITNVRTDENSITFDLDIDDPNGFVKDAYAVLYSSWSGDEITRLEDLSLKDNKFANIYSEHCYRIEIVYTFNANLREDRVSSNNTYDIYTSGYVINISADNIIAGYDSVTFDVNIEDEHNRAQDIKIEIVTYNGDKRESIEVEYTGNKTYTVNGLYSNRWYEIYVSVMFDGNHNDTDPIRHTSNSFGFSTLAYDTPEVSLNFTSYEKHSINYDIEFDDPNNFIKYVEVNVYLDDELIETAIHEEAGSYVIDGLYAGRTYEFRYKYIFNANTLLDEESCYHSTWEGTASYEASLQEVWFENISYNKITLDVKIKNVDNIDSYLLIHVYNHETGEFIKTVRFDDPTSGQFTIDGLNPYVTYTFGLEFYADYRDGNEFTTRQGEWHTGYETTPGPVDAYYDTVIVDNSYTSIDFLLKLYNEHNTLAEGDVVVTVYDQNNNIIATFVNPGDEVLHVEGLEPNTDYRVYITYYVDRMDGNGPVQTEWFTWICTKYKSAPTLNVENLEVGCTDAEFDITIADTDNVLLDYEIYAVRSGYEDNRDYWIKGTIDENGHVVFKGLYDNYSYRIYVVYTCNFGNSEGIHEVVDTPLNNYSFTTEKIIRAPSCSVTLVEVTDDSITIDVIIDDEQGIIESQYIKLTDPYNTENYITIKINGSGRYTIENLGSDRHYFVDVYFEYYRYGSLDPNYVYIENGVYTNKNDTAVPAYYVHITDEDYGYVNFKVDPYQGRDRVSGGYVIVETSNGRQVGVFELDENLSVTIALNPLESYTFWTYMYEDSDTLLPITNSIGGYGHTLRGKETPSFNVENWITYEDAASGDFIITDRDNTLIDAKYKLYYYDDFMEEYVYVKDVEVDENGHFAITGLDPYRTYYIFVEYSYNLNNKVETSETSFSFWTGNSGIAPKTQATNGTRNDDGTFTANIQAGARKEYVTGYTVNIYDGWGNLIDTIEIEGNSSTITIEWLSQYEPNTCRIELITHYDCNDGTGVHSFTSDYYFYRY